MKILFENLETEMPIDLAVILSLDMSMYQLLVFIDGEERLVWESVLLPLTARSLTAMRDRIKHLALGSIVMRQNSAYDEMISQPLRVANTLELPLSLTPPLQ